ARVAYITGSPFVFIELYGVPPEQYGLLFGLNAIGLIAAAQLNHRLLARYEGRTILNAVLPLAALAGGALALIAATGIGGLVGLLIPLFFCVASRGIVGPNAMGAALAPQGRNAGSAAALIGVLQFGTGGIAGALGGLLN